MKSLAIFVVNAVSIFLGGLTFMNFCKELDKGNNYWAGVYLGCFVILFIGAGCMAKKYFEDED